MRTLHEYCKKPSEYFVILFTVILSPKLSQLPYKKAIKNHFILTKVDEELHPHGITTIFLKIYQIFLYVILSYIFLSLADLLAWYNTK